jgi:hypothetical protein
MALRRGIKPGSVPTRSIAPHQEPSNFIYRLDSGFFPTFLRYHRVYEKA